MRLALGLKGTPTLNGWVAYTSQIEWFVKDWGIPTNQHTTTPPSMLSSSSQYKQPLFLIFNFLHLFIANLCKNPYFLDEHYQSIFIFLYNYFLVNLGIF